MAARIRQRGLARAARVRDRLPRGAFGERGDVPKDPLKGEAAPRAEAPCWKVSGACPPSMKSSGGIRVVGRGYGQQEAESRFERWASAAGRALLGVHTHKFKADGTLVLHFRSSCEVSNVSAGGVCRRAPAWPCARRRYNPALSPARPLPPARSPGVRADQTAPRREGVPPPQWTVPGRPQGAGRLARHGRCRAKPRNLRGPGRPPPRGGQRRAARRSNREPDRKADRRLIGASQWEP